MSALTLGRICPKIGEKIKRYLKVKQIPVKNLNKTSLVSIIFILILVLSAANIVHAVEVTATIPVNFAGPIVYDSGKGEIFVANWGSNTVSVISDNNNTVVATVPTGTNSVDQSHPIGVAYDSAKGEIYVVNSYPYTSGSGTVSVISDSTNTVLASIPVGDYPYYAAYDSGKGEIFVTNNEDYMVSVISDSTNTVVANVTLPYGSWGVAYDSAKGEIFVANQGGAVFVISDSTNTFVATVTLGRNFDSHCVAYDAAKGEMFVTNNGNDMVSVLSDSPITSRPTVLGFNSVGLILVVVAVVVVTLCAVALAVRKSTRTRSASKQI